MLPLFALIPDSAFSLFTSLLYIFLDLLCTDALITIAESGESFSSRLFTSPRKDIKWDSVAIGAAYAFTIYKMSTDGLTCFRYIFNPFTIATCIGRPTSVFTNCAILYAIAKAVEGKSLSSMLALALAAYLSLYPALLFPPIFLLCYDQSRKRGKPASPFAFSLTHFSVFSASIAWFLYVSYLLTGGSWEFLSSTYGVHLLLPDLTPNIGLWWYFFIEMFDSFREFFLGVFWLHLGGYVGGLCIRLRSQPLFIITSLLGIFAIFKPYPSISDTSLYFALLPLYRHIFPRKFKKTPMFCQANIH